MSDPAGTHNEGGVVFGSQVITISSVAYIAENISTDQDSNVIERKNEVGICNGQVFVEQVKTGSATLQLADAATEAPAIGDSFTLIPIGGGAAISFSIKKVGASWSQDSETKVSVDFRKTISES